MEAGNRTTTTRATGALVVLFLVLATPAPALAESLADAVRQAEIAFADSMAQRDFDAFQSFLAEDAVFFGGSGAAHGKQAVADRWASYFEEEAAPFSWAPEHVEVLASGDLGFSSGPVYNSSGRRTATYHSVWRLEEDGRWRIVFDKGARWCPPPETDT